MLATGCGGGPQPTAHRIEVTPRSGASDVAPGTSILFRSKPRLAVINVHAVGSRSGYHEGVLQPLPGGAGEAFLPAHQFAAGERVAVYAEVRLGRHLENIGTRFHVAR